MLDTTTDRHVFGHRGRRQDRLGHPLRTQQRPFPTASSTVNLRGFPNHRHTRDIREASEHARAFDVPERIPAASRPGRLFKASWPTAGSGVLDNARDAERSARSCLPHPLPGAVHERNIHCLVAAGASHQPGLFEPSWPVTCWPPNRRLPGRPASSDAVTASSSFARLPLALAWSRRAPPTRLHAHGPGSRTQRRPRQPDEFSAKTRHGPRACSRGTTCSFPTTRPACSGCWACTSARTSAPGRRQPRRCAVSRSVRVLAEWPSPADRSARAAGLVHDLLRAYATEEAELIEYARTGSGRQASWPLHPHANNATSCSSLRRTSDVVDLSSGGPEEPKDAVEWFDAERRCCSGPAPAAEYTSRVWQLVSTTQRYCRQGHCTTRSRIDVALDAAAGWPT